MGISTIRIATESETKHSRLAVALYFSQIDIRTFIKRDIYFHRIFYLTPGGTLQMPTKQLLHGAAKLLHVTFPLTNDDDIQGTSIASRGRRNYRQPTFAL